MLIAPGIMIFSSPSCTADQKLLATIQPQLTSISALRTSTTAKSCPAAPAAMSPFNCWTVIDSTVALGTGKWENHDFALDIGNRILPIYADRRKEVAPFLCILYRSTIGW